MNIRTARLKPALLALFAGLSCCMAAAQPMPTITVAWRLKPPYHYAENGELKGLLLLRAQAIFSEAGISTRFVNEPQRRIWNNLAHGEPNYCSVSWYRLPEREAVAQFSQPFHMDQTHIVLTATRNQDEIKAHATLPELLADKELTLGVIDGVSYGPELDAMMARSANQIMRRTVDTPSMLRMLAAGRATYVIVDRADWTFFKERDPLAQTLVMLEYPDMPAGLPRHIVCSSNVPEGLMEKLNRAIASTPGTPGPSSGTGTPRKRRGEALRNGQGRPMPPWRTSATDGPRGKERRADCRTQSATHFD
ncbi:ABC transporter substrate-binding protein [Massilia sp. NR 4-1]|uniref:substrate-binding periplasmic protein n=1 Tax=Massilia sp. NR 4-1 TaxID=1678028 RepID=UPI00067CD582|nr:transporter substrate-binding domain-containing protein [Massilia sp. NR 4-1]